MMFWISRPFKGNIMLEYSKDFFSKENKRLMGKIPFNFTVNAKYKYPVIKIHICDC